MPSSHRRYLDWTHERIQREAAAIGDDTAALVDIILRSRPHPGGDWIRQSQHLVISGPTGVGKSWLACALGHKACRDGFSVLYRRAPRLFSELAVARGEGRLPRMLATLERTRLLIIDDWGPEPLTAEELRDLLEIVDDRYEKGSLLVTSQIPVKRWHELMGDPTIGDAILDRVVHRAHRLELKGPSLRKRGAVSPTAESDPA